MWPRGWVEVQLYCSMAAALEGGEWSAACLGHTLPPGKTRYPFYRRLGGPTGPVWTGGKSRLHRDSIPDRPARSSVAKPTELPGPHNMFWYKSNNSHETSWFIKRLEIFWQSQEMLASQEILCFIQFSSYLLESILISRLLSYNAV